MDSARLAARHRAEAPRRRSAAAFLRRQLDVPGQAVSVLLVAAESAALIGLLWLLALTLASIVDAGGVPSNLTPALVALALLALVRAALHALGEVYHTRQAITVTTRLRQQLLPAAMQPQWRLRHSAGPAHLATRLGRELDSLQPWYAGYRPALLAAIIQPVLILAVVFPHDWLAGTLLLLTAPLIPMFMALIGMGVSALAEDQHRRLARLGDLFMDRLQALPLLRITRQTEDAASEVEAAAHGWRQAAMRVLRVAFLSTAVLEFFAAVAIATVAIYVGMALLGYISFGPAPRMTLASGLVILVLAPEFFAPLRLLGQRYHDRATALAAAAGLAEEFSENTPPATHANAARWSAPPAIALQDLALQPPGSDHPLPLQINIQIAAGEWLAITGPSGCGKTTLAHTLLGFHPPHSGELLIDGRTLEAIPESELRMNTNWMDQQAPLLAASLRRNIAPGDPAPAVQRLREAAHAAGLTEVIDALPNSLDTRLGEDGAGLSGGERRRVALARALYTRPGLLVLDEPTAGLDPDTEAGVLDTLRRLAGDCTIVMFTHSEAAANAADRRFALDGGGP